MIKNSAMQLRPERMVPGTDIDQAGSQRWDPRESAVDGEFLAVVVKNRLNPISGCGTP
jgi:hypothetical protein